MNWHQYFLELCQQIKTRSKDQSTKIGVVIVGQYLIKEDFIKKL
jgi:deoxycytidylate deaminase